MERNYDTGKSNNVEFFLGTEVEHTPAYGKKTLFVVGVHPNSTIENWLSKVTLKDVEHIYFGANMSFPNPKINDSETWSKWETMIQQCLDQGYWCTLDVDISSAEGLCEGGLVEHANFIPMISAKLPYINLLGYNATLKLDDKDFKASNPGVWCHSIHDLMDRNKFTNWAAYTKDEVVK